MPASREEVLAAATGRVVAAVRPGRLTRAVAFVRAEVIPVPGHDRCGPGTLRSGVRRAVCGVTETYVANMTCGDADRSVRW
jgi:hypothetical protein